MFSFLRRSTPEVSVDELDALLRDRNARVLDVREDWEYRQGHVPGAIHIPLGLLGHHYGSLPRDARILVICQSGHRSLAATDLLLAQGFEGAASVRGGTAAWARSGRELDRGAARVA